MRRRNMKLPDRPPETTGECIRWLRRGRGMRVAELAEGLDVTEKRIYYWETDGTMPADLVPPLCRALGTTPNELLGWEEH